jgi:hypothetical protein
VSQPPRYSPSHSFISDVTTGTFPGQALDVEFAAIEAVTDAIENNLALIQRDDGQLANSSVGYDQLSPALQTSGVAPANAWMTGTAYIAGTPVIQAGTLYRCLVPHTSGVFATDLAAGDWVFVAALTAAFLAGDNLTLTANVFSVSTSPHFTTPNIDAATAVSVNGLTINPTTGTLAIANGKTATFNNTTTFTGTDGTTQTFPGSSGNVVTSVTAAGGALTGTFPNPTLAAAAVANVNIANMAAWTLKGNATTGSAAPTDITIDGLTLKASPASGDEMMIWDVSGSAWKKVTVSSVGSAGSVSSIAGNTGTFTLSNGIKNVANDIQADPVFHRSYLTGLTLSTAGSSATFGIAAGVAVDSTNAGFMSLATAFTKTTSAWSLGAAGGALDTGTIANSTWYHVYLIKRTDTGVVDVVVSANASAPALPTNYTLFRRIGSLLTNGSAQWVLFSQNGDEFLWSTPVNDINTTTLGTTPTLFSTSVPPGIKVNVMFRAYMIATSAQAGVLINSPDEAIAAVNSPNGNFSMQSGTIGTTAGTLVTLNVRTNTASQIRAVAQFAGTTLATATFGYIDTRGKLN